LAAGLDREYECEDEVGGLVEEELGDIWLRVGTFPDVCDVECVGRGGLSDICWPYGG
jgi:hypothetical protein